MLGALAKPRGPGDGRCPHGSHPQGDVRASCRTLLGFFIRSCGFIAIFWESFLAGSLGQAQRSWGWFVPSWPSPPRRCKSLMHNFFGGVYKITWLYCHFWGPFLTGSLGWNKALRSEQRFHAQSRGCGRRWMQEDPRDSTARLWES